MIKVFTLNKNNKIELTKEELQALLDQSYWDGYRANDRAWTYNSPSITVPHYTSATLTVAVDTENNTTVSNMGA